MSADEAGNAPGGSDRPNLSESQMQALRELGRKKAGDPVGFINIAAARALTELGLAIRTREGWDITPAGGALLHTLPRPPSAPPGHILG